MQVRERLLDPYFHQWLRDTEELLEKLPRSLDSPEQSLALSLTFERWLLQLKVWLALSPEVPESEAAASCVVMPCISPATTSFAVSHALSYELYSPL